MWEGERMGRGRADEGEEVNNMDESIGMMYGEK